MRNGIDEARRRGFTSHATVFVLVLIYLVALNWWLGGYYWVQWVLLGWGMGLAAHAWAAFRKRGGEHRS